MKALTHLLACLLTLFITQSFAQSTFRHYAWEPHQEAIIYDAIQDSAGNIYVAGYSGNRNFFDFDYYLAKLNPNRTMDWDKEVPIQVSVPNLSFSELEFHPDGNLLAGGAASPCDYVDAYLHIHKFGPNGSSLWTSELHFGPNMKEVSRLCGVPDGSVFVAAEDTLFKLSPSGDSLWRTPVSVNTPSEMFHSDGKLWILGDSIAVMDTASGSYVLSGIGTLLGQAIHVQDSQFFAYSGNTVRHFNGRNLVNSFNSIPLTGTGTIHLQFDNGYLYLINDDNMIRVDTANGSTTSLNFTHHDLFSPTAPMLKNNKLFFAGFQARPYDNYNPVVTEMNLTTGNYEAGGIDVKLSNVYYDSLSITYPSGPGGFANISFRLQAVLILSPFSSSTLGNPFSFTVKGKGFRMCGTSTEQLPMSFVFFSPGDSTDNYLGWFFDQTVSPGDLANYSITICKNNPDNFLDVNPVDECLELYLGNLTEISPGTDPDQFTIFPNPADKSVEISSLSLAPWQFEILSVEGKSVKTQQHLQGPTRISTQDLSDGIYILKIMQSGKVQTEKLVVRH